MFYELSAAASPLPKRRTCFWGSLTLLVCSHNSVGHQHWRICVSLFQKNSLSAMFFYILKKRKILTDSVVSRIFAHVLPNAAASNKRRNCKLKLSAFSAHSLLSSLCSYLLIPWVLDDRHFCFLGSEHVVPFFSCIPGHFCECCMGKWEIWVYVIITQRLIFIV